MPMKQCQLRGFPQLMFRCDSNSLHIGGLNPQSHCCESFAITTRLNFIVDRQISSQMSDNNDLTQFSNIVLSRSKMRVYMKMKMSILHPKHESVFLKAQKKLLLRIFCFPPSFRSFVSHPKSVLTFRSVPSVLSSVYS